MKRFLLFLLCCSLCGVNFAQSSDFQPLSSSSQVSVLAKISSAITSLQCQFMQEKSSTMLADVVRSKGTMSFVAPNKLRWEYQSPQPFTFIYCNGQSQSLNADGKAIKQNNRMAQEMSRLIVGIISGESLNNLKQFKVSCFEGTKQYKIHLQPLNSRLKTMMKDIELLVNRNNFVATSIQINEAGGDVTLIRFLQPKINTSLSDSLFQIR